jgi:hypothetical protein
MEDSSTITATNRIAAPADLAATQNGETTEDPKQASPLGLVPHQLRCFLAQFKTMLIEGAAYDRCTGCSATVSLREWYIARYSLSRYTILRPLRWRTLTRKTDSSSF